ncbi:MAG: hypothetical protein QM762_21765 [Chryseolinea sp.]
MINEFRGQIPSVEDISSQLSMTPVPGSANWPSRVPPSERVSLRFRKDLAEQLFKGGTARKQRVASMLGYADADTLRRAIKASGAV